MKRLKKLRSIEPPKKEIRLGDGDMSLLLGGDYCATLHNDHCKSFHTGPCSGSSGQHLNVETTVLFMKSPNKDK